MKVFLTALGCILGWIILVGAGAYVDIRFLLVHGIKEIVHGAQASPVSGDLIAWGAAHVVFSGVGMFVAVVLAMVWTALLTTDY